MSNTFAKIRALLIAELTACHLFREEPDVQLDSGLNDLGVDDLDRMALGMEIEEAFGIHVSDADERHWDTVADMVRMVDARVRSLAS